MSRSTDVTIVGGGVVGAYLAYRLALEGVAVTLVERERAGAWASGASAGNVQPGEFEPIAGAERLNPLEAESLALHRRFLPQIKAESGIDPLDHAVTYFYAARDEAEVTQTQRFAAALQGLGLQVEWIDGVAARRLEPRLAPDIRGGAWHRDCLQMDAPRFVAALLTAAARRGVRLRRAEVAALRRAGGRVTGVQLHDGSAIGGEAVVLAMGAWTAGALRRWCGMAVPIAPYSLQKIHVRPGGSPPACAVRWGGVNIVGRLDGLVHVGSLHEEQGFDARPTAAGRRWLLERLQTVLPTLEVQVVEAGAGVAAWLPGRLPLLGPIPGCEGLYMAVPSSNGFLLSAALAQILTDRLVHGCTHAFWPMLQPARVLPSAITP
jgi:glycine oxidase